VGLRDFESRLERLVEGTFSKAFKSGLQPVELGRKVVRAIDDGRTIGVRGTVAPNHLEVALSKADADRFAGFGDALARELADVAREHAREEGYHFMGPVSVSLLVDNETKPGRFGIESSMRESGGGVGTGCLVMPSGERLPLGAQVITVGRLPACSITINDANVSRNHAEIRAKGSSFVVVDLGSTNGTKLNGNRITGENALKDGDVVSFGGTNIRFEAS
jgi:hypothetical protein